MVLLKRKQIRQNLQDTLEPFLRKTKYTLRSLRFRDSEVILKNTNFEEEQQESERCFWGRISGTYFETIKDLETWQLHTTKEQIYI